MPWPLGLTCAFDECASGRSDGAIQRPLCADATRAGRGRRGLASSSRSRAIGWNLGRGNHPGANSPAQGRRHCGHRRRRYSGRNDRGVFGTSAPGLRTGRDDHRRECVADFRWCSGPRRHLSCSGRATRTHPDGVPGQPRSCRRARPVTSRTAGGGNRGGVRQRGDLRFRPRPGGDQ